MRALEYLQEENRIPREQLGGRRLRFIDAQRRRFAAKGKALDRRVLQQVASLVTPDTVLRLCRELIVNKYDGSASRGCIAPASKRRSRVPWKVPSIAIST